ncbi:MAG: SDR family NAD(P)-dependent oxidoreductase [Desulfobacterales bacterium]|nr:SDR family NAD(P)-dependent oxidoreductase [Desulfobacterales bacterium]
MKNLNINIRKILDMIAKKQISSEAGMKLIKKLEEPKLQSSESELLYFQTSWKKDITPHKSNFTLNKKECFLIFDSEPYNIKQCFSGAKSVFIIRKADKFRQEDNHFEINQESLDDFKKLISTIQDLGLYPSSVIYNWCENQNDFGQIYPIFNLTKAFIEQKIENKLRLLYLFETKKETPHPLNSMISGFNKTLRLEKPNFIYKTISVYNIKDLSNEILSLELSDGFDDFEVFYDKNQRFLKKLEKTDLKDNKAIGLKEKGVYIITGGLGGLGLIFAEYIAKKANATIILCGRKDLTENNKQKIKSIESKNSEIDYIKADISKADEAVYLIEIVKQKYGTINGIIHAAGVNKDSFVIKKTQDEISTVLSPKVLGTFNIDKATKDFQLDFFMLFSSTAAIFGNIGQSDYAAANAFLDDFSKFREYLKQNNERFGRTIVINWPYWKQGGMHVSEQDQMLTFEQTGFAALPTEFGLKAWDEIIKSGENHVAVLYGNKEKIDNYIASVFSKESLQPDIQKIEDTIKIDTEELLKKTEDFLTSLLSDEIKVSKDIIKPKTNFEEYGIDSILIKKFNIKIEKELGKLPKTLLFEYQTIHDLSLYLIKNHESKLINVFGLIPAKPKLEIPEKISVPISVTPQKIETKIISQKIDDDIAIIGLSGRYPLSENIDEFWENIKSGKDCITEIPEFRWDYKKYYDPDPYKAIEGKIYCKWGGFINDADKFDPLFFNISPKEAEMMDPQERIFLQTIWESFEDAGYTRQHLIPNDNSSLKIGVFAGVTTYSYQALEACEWLKGNILPPGSLTWSIANRVSYFFNFQGPSMPVDTACSSSLTAIHLACESLKKGECSVAIAGGVNLYLHPIKYIGLCRMRMLSPVGRCKSFGSDSDGFVPGEGVGAIILKNLSDAIRDNDQIYGVIKSTAINHGGKTHGYTVPNPNAQGDVIISALEKAGINPRTMSYIEAHGTGTSLGDPVEISGLTKAFSKYTSDKNFCSIGSVKTNIGHLESAAGIAGITKILLQMKHKLLAPSLHAKELNPNIDFEESAFYVQKTADLWKRPVIIENGEENVYPFRAGISSFGAGGANAHIIIEEYYNDESSKVNYTDGIKNIFVLSAKNKERLKEYAEKFLKFIDSKDSSDDLFFYSMNYTLQTRRESMDERLAVIVSDINELKDKLSAFIADEKNIKGLYLGNIKSKNIPEDKDDELSKIAISWINGADIDFNKFYENQHPQKISLPTYPFAKERYFMPIDDKGAFTVLSEKTIHPLIHLNISTLKEEKFLTTFTGEEFFLKDHIVSGKKVLPGVAYLEMARSAGEIACETSIVKIKNIVWSKPIIVDSDQKKIKTILSPKDDSVEFEISSDEGIHSTGSLSFDSLGKPDFINISEIKNRCPSVLSTNDFYKIFKKTGMNYGQSFNVVSELHQGKKECLAVLHIPEWTPTDNYVIHPSLMDGALQSVLGLMSQNELETGKPWLPFTILEIEIKKSLNSNCYAYAQIIEEKAQIKKINIKIADESGEVIASVKNYSIRQYTMPHAQSEIIYLKNFWKERPIQSISKQNLPILVFNASQDIYANLSKFGTKIIKANAGQEFKKIGDLNFELNYSDLENFRKLFTTIKDEQIIPQSLIYFCPKEEFAADVIDERLDSVVYPIFYSIKALFESRIPGKFQVLCVQKSNDKNPLLSAISGIGKAVSKENPNIYIKTLKTDDVNEILAEIQIRDGFEVLYQNGNRYIKAFEEVKNTSNNITLKKDGVYLITGGLGGLGFIFAKEIAEKTQSAIFLTGRSDMLPSMTDKIKQLKSFGSNVFYIRSDISNQNNVNEIVKIIKSKFNRINGVIHSAGTLKDSFIIKKTQEEIDAVISPKIFGTMYIDDALKDEELDFFVMFSSLSSAFGNAGQSDYAFANSFMDNFAQIREDLRSNNKRKGVTLSINWPFWKEGGMRIDEASVVYTKEKLGIIPIETTDGIKAFYDALNFGFNQISVVTGLREKIYNTLLKQDAEPLQIEEIKTDEQKSIDKHDDIIADDIKEKTENFLKEILSKEIKLQPQRINSKEAMEAYGIDSLMITGMTRQLEKYFGELPKTLFFEYQTIEELGNYFIENYREKLVLRLKIKAPQTKQEIPKEAPKQIIKPQKRFFKEKISDVQESEDIAIIGLSGRYPLADDLDEFWENLKIGKDCIIEIPKDRWDYRDYLSKNNGKPYCKWGGFINDVDKFDPLFFNITPKDAEIMEPQERLFLETAWHTIEDAGYTRAELSKVKTGVFVGVMYSQYQLFRTEENGKPIIPASSYASMANRVSYIFNLSGPSIALDTMCSSSLTSIHLACESIKRKECDYAIAGGVNVSIHPDKYTMLRTGGFSASDGRCKSFGIGGDGYVPGEGVGAVLLKPLNKAIEDNDYIYGIIKGSSLNHGGKTNGYTVPNPNAQANLIEEAFKKANLDPRKVSYIEAHGTGTSLGDPIEIVGLSKSFKKLNSGLPKQYCSIGSLKSNIGHLESAAGIAGVTKILLQLKYKKLVPSLHSNVLSPNINFNETSFYVQQTLADWKQPSFIENGIEKIAPRIAGISSFGAGGSNAHAVIEEFSGLSGKSSHATGPFIFVLSAKNKTSLMQYAKNLYDFFIKIKQSSVVIDENDVLNYIKNSLKGNISNILNVNINDIESDISLEEYGFDNIKFVILADKIAEKFGIEITISTLLENNSLDLLGNYFILNNREKIFGYYNEEIKPADSPYHNDESLMADAAYTLQLGRESMDERLAFVSSNMDESLDILSKYIKGEKNIDNFYAGNATEGLEKAELFIDGKEGNEFVKIIINEKKLPKIAKLWTSGINIDWNLFYGDSKHKRRPLPKYPFLKERYWVPTSFDFSFSKQLKLHPLIHENASTFMEEAFISEFKGNEFYFRDHIAYGKKILPGAAYIEMARASGNFASQYNVIEINNIAWAKPISVDDKPIKVKTILIPEKNSAAFQILSDDGIIHCSGKLKFGDKPLSNENINISAIKQRCTNKLAKKECYDIFSAINLEYGSSFQTISEIYFNETEALSYLDLAEELNNEFSEFILHTSLLDGAFQTILGFSKEMIDSSGSPYLPFAMEKLEIIAPIPQKCFAYVKASDKDKKGNVRKFDIFILDDDGNILVKIEEFSVRALKSTFEEESLYFEKTWDLSELIVHPTQVISHVILFDLHSQSDNLPLFSNLKSDSTKISVIKVNESFQKNDYLSVMENIKNQNLSVSHIVNLWGDVLGNSMEFYSQMLYLSQALMEQKSKDKIKILSVFLGADNVNKALFSALSAFGKTLSIENPKFYCKNIFINFNSPFVFNWQNLIGEFYSQDCNEINYIEGKRYVAQFKEIDVTKKVETKLSIKENGVYLITGGLGGLGFIFAEYLAEKFKAKLVLSGRREIDVALNNKLLHLTSKGGDPIYIKADVSNENEVTNLISEAKKKFKNIDGVIHSAGVLKDSLIFRKTQKEAETVIFPKIIGTINLDKALKSEHLEFFALFSSTAGVFGNTGQSDYAYANAFMDNYCGYRETLRKQEKRFGSSISFNWPLWQKGGMNIDDALKNRLKETLGVVPLRTQNGINAFEQGLKLSLSQCIVIYGQKNKIQKIFDVKKEIEKISEQVADSEQIKSSAKDLEKKTEEFLKAILSSETKIPIDRIGSKELFESLGIESMMIVNMTRELEKDFGELSKTLFFEYQSIFELASYFIQNHSEKLMSKLFGKKETFIKSPKIEHKLEKASSTFSNRFSATTSDKKEIEFEDIAIIGISGRFPMAANLNQFWENLKQGKDCIIDIPKERWDLNEYFDLDRSKIGKAYSKWGSFIDDADKFDPLFFNISPKEAEGTDPQERIFLETAWKTIEDAGYTRETLSQDKVGVFVGVMYGLYQMFYNSMNSYKVMPSSSYASIANRVSYVMNFKGPSMSIDTMCSSSLTAVHLACESIYNKECSLALAGGVNLSVHPYKYSLLSFGSFLSSDGRCRSFGDGGDGYVPGEGVGALLLKPLSAAVSDGDHIYGIIKATAVNHGGKTNGYSVPSPNAQKDVIDHAIKKAGISPKTISYIETHGTGTSLGDPIEITGLMKAFSNLEGEYKCPIGSVKSNIGHLESAAGVAGITKILLQLKHKQIAPSIHSKQLNPNIKFDNTPFFVPQNLIDWETNYPRRAGISSFGAGGSNAHVIIEEYADYQEVSATSNNSRHLMILSAKNKERLIEYTKALAEFLAENPDSSSRMDDIAYTFMVGREEMDTRIAIVVSDMNDFILKLKAFSIGELNGIYFGQVKSKDIVDVNPEEIKESNIENLAIAFVSGKKINWDLLYTDKKVKRISLPTYQFAKDRYWIKAVEHKKVISGTVGVLHPLIDSNESTIDEQCYKKVFYKDSNFTVLLLGNTGVSPFVYHEMAYTAGNLANKKAKVSALKNIEFGYPAIFHTDNIDAYIGLYPKSPDNVDFEIKSSDDAIIFAKGEIIYKSVDLSADSMDILAIKKRCTKIDNIQLTESLIKFEEIFTDASEGIARISINSENLEIGFNEDVFYLHPSFVHAGFKLISLINNIKKEDEQYYYPLNIDKIVVISKFTKNFYIYVKSHSNGNLVVFLDEFGKKIAEIEGFKFGITDIEFDYNKIKEILEKFYNGAINTDEAEAYLENL